MAKRRRPALLSREELAAEDAPLKPLAERPATEILRAVLELFWLLRLWHHQARGETFLICDRGAITKTGIVPVYLDHELPLREAGELVADLLRPYPLGHAWRWRLVLCPVRERTRAGIHLLLMDPPRKGRPWSEPMWLRSSTAGERGKRPGPQAESRERSGGSERERSTKPRAGARSDKSAPRVPGRREEKRVSPVEVSA